MRAGRAPGYLVPGSLVILLTSVGSFVFGHIEELLVGS